MQSHDSKAQAIRNLLVSKRSLSADEIAQMVGSSREYVYKQMSTLRRQGKSVPKREKAASVPPVDHLTPQGGGVVVEPVPPQEKHGSLADAGLRFVRVSLTPHGGVGGRSGDPPIEEAPKEGLPPPSGWRHDCGATGTLPVPARCPSCGGA